MIYSVPAMTLNFGSGLLGASLRLALWAPLRITSCNSPFGSRIARSNLLLANLVGRANLLQANLYFGLPALRPFGAALRAFKTAPGSFVEQRVRIKSSLSAIHKKSPN